MYKQFINQRLNIITILKKLEIIEIPENTKKNTININNNNANNNTPHIKMINRKYNNFMNDNSCFK